MHIDTLASSIVNTIALIVTIVTMARKFFKRFEVIELQMRIIWEKQATPEEKFMLRQLTRRINGKDS